jgi:hypothetical protein
MRTSLGLDGGILDADGNVITGTTDGNDFEQLAQRWKVIPFPAGSQNDELDDLHARLVLADTWLADSVLPYLRDRTWARPVVDVVGELEAIISASRHFTSASTSEGLLAAEYRNYADVLMQLYLAFLGEEPSDQAVRRPHP